MFYGEKLKTLRLLKEMSRLELAIQFGLTEQTVWQYEIDEKTPEMLIKMKLAAFFGVQLAYFEEAPEQLEIDSSGIAFRNANTISRKIINFQEAYLNHICHYMSYLEQFLRFPVRCIFELAHQPNHMFHSGIVIEEIASFAKEQLKVAIDNSDLLYQLEKSGIYILEKKLVGTEDAYSTWSKSGTPFIVLGIGKTAVRRHFDLAHELGHLLLHRGVDFESLDKYDLLTREAEANRFAGAFLLPEKQFKEDVQNYLKNKLSNPDHYIVLKEKYFVSIQAMEYRAYQLGLLSNAQHSYFYRLLHQKGYKQEEPLDREMLLKRPTKIRSMLNVIFEHNLMSIEQLLKAKNISLRFLADMLCIEQAFFEKYREVPKNNVIDIKSLAK